MRGVAGDGADPAPTPQTPLLPCLEENLAQIWLHGPGSLGGTFQPSRGMLHPPWSAATNTDVPGQASSRAWP